MTNVTYIYSRLLLGFLIIHVLLQSLDNSCIPDPLPTSSNSSYFRQFLPSVHWRLLDTFFPGEAFTWLCWLWSSFSGTACTSP